MYKVFYITPKHTNLMNEIKFINNKNKPVKIAIGLYNSKKPICSDKDLSEEEKYMYRGREHGLEVPILEDDHEYSYIYILYEDNTIQVARYGSTEIESPYFFKIFLIIFGSFNVPSTTVFLCLLIISLTQSTKYLSTLLFFSISGIFDL